MAETYDWAGFYGALCSHGPQLLLGADDEDGSREVIVALAATTDEFWSDGLQDVLAHSAAEGDLRTGVLATLELWRENVLTTLSESYGIELEWGAVTIDVDSPLVDQLVEAATPKDSPPDEPAGVR